jgi:hypothetical protein
VSVRLCESKAACAGARALLEQEPQNNFKFSYSEFPGIPEEIGDDLRRAGSSRPDIETERHKGEGKENQDGASGRDAAADKDGGPVPVVEPAAYEGDGNSDGDPAQSREA